MSFLTNIQSLEPTSISFINYTKWRIQFLGGFHHPNLDPNLKDYSCGTLKLRLLFCVKRGAKDEAIITWSKFLIPEKGNCKTKKSWEGVAWTPSWVDEGWCWKRSKSYAFIYCFHLTLILLRFPTFFDYFLSVLMLFFLFSTIKEVLHHRPILYLFVH